MEERHYGPRWLHDHDDGILQWGKQLHFVTSVGSEDLTFMILMLYMMLTSIMHS